MENQTSFDLNHAIQGWRDNLAQSPAFRAENLEELEAHLRDSVAALQTRGLSGEESFLIAARRIGRGASLETEFGKVNGQTVWLDRILWMLLGTQLWSLVFGTIGAITRNAAFFGLSRIDHDLTGYGLTMATLLLLALHLAGFGGSLALCWWLLMRKGRAVGSWSGKLLRRRSAFAIFAYASLVSLLAYLLSVFGQMVVVRKISPMHSAHLWELNTYSYLATYLIQTATLTALTVFLARRRLAHRAGPGEPRRY